MKKVVTLIFGIHLFVWIFCIGEKVYEEGGSTYFCYSTVQTEHRVYEVKIKEITKSQFNVFLSLTKEAQNELYNSKNI